MEDPAPTTPFHQDLAALRQRVTDLEAALTAQQHGEQALREARDYAAQIVETIRDPLLVLTPDFRVQRANPAFYALFQLSPAETEGQFIYQIGQGQWDIPALRALLEEILPQNTVFNDYEVHHDFARLGPRTLLLNARRLDNVPLILLAMEDITAWKRATESLYQAQAELAHLMRVLTLGALMTSLAHEVNQPLAAMLYNAQACLRWLGRGTPELEEVREALRDIVTDGRRAGAIIAQIRADLKKAPTHMRPLDLNQVIAEVVERTHHEVQDAAVQVRTDLTAALPPMRGDPVQIQQVLLNLVLNGLDAVRAVRDRPRELLIRSGRTVADGVVVAVHDTGIGLDLQTLERIFDPFFTTKSTGLGMGLSISRTIIEAHGGRLWAERNLDHGLTVHFTIPPAGAHAEA